MRGSKLQSTRKNQSRTLYWVFLVFIAVIVYVLYSCETNCLTSTSPSLSRRKVHVNMNGLILILGWLDPFYSARVCFSTLLVLTHWLMAGHREPTAKQTCLFRAYLWHGAQVFVEKRNKELLATSTSPGSTWCHSTLWGLRGSESLFVIVTSVITSPPDFLLDVVLLITAKHDSAVWLEHVSPEALKPASFRKIRLYADSFHCFTVFHSLCWSVCSTQVRTDSLFGRLLPSTSDLPLP